MRCRGGPLEAEVLEAEVLEAEVLEAEVGSSRDQPAPHPWKRPHGAGGQTSSSLKTPSSLMTVLYTPDLVPEQRTHLRPAVQRSRDSMWNRINKVYLSFRRLKGRPDVRQLGVTVQRPNAALNYTSVCYSP
ncbi:unnamed protein product [Boreogadus saida]